MKLFAAGVLLVLILIWRIEIRHLFSNTLNFVIYNRKVVKRDRSTLTPKLNRDVVFVYSHDYSVIPEYNKYSRWILNKYCSMHNYKMVEFNHKTNNISPYWLRVKDLMNLCNEYDDGAIFIYMDLDTCLNPNELNTSVNDLIAQLDHANSWNMYVGKDINLTCFINTGVIIVKNTEWSRSMLKLWWSKYNPTNWVNFDGKWSCYDDVERGRSCEWAKDNYEQGELEKLYRSDALNAKSNIAICAAPILGNASFSNSRDTFMFHAFGQSTDQRVRLFKKILKKYYIE